jgi:hypothetical protein
MKMAPSEVSGRIRAGVLGVASGPAFRRSRGSRLTHGKCLQTLTMATKSMKHWIGHDAW